MSKVNIKALNSNMSDKQFKLLRFDSRVFTIP